MFLSWSYSALDIFFATGKRVNNGGQYGMEIRANFLFYEPKKTIDLAKKMTKAEENLNETVKHYLK